MNDNQWIYQSERTLTSLGEQKARVIPTGSILCTCIGSTIGKVACNAVPCAVNQQINALIPNENIHPDYIYYVLLMLEKKIKRLAGSTAVPIINKSQFSSLSILLPNYKEQIKVSDHSKLLE